MVAGRRRHHSSSHKFDLILSSRKAWTSAVRQALPKPPLRPQDGNRKRDDQRFEHENRGSGSERSCRQEKFRQIDRRIRRMSPAISRYLKDFGAERLAAAAFDSAPSLEKPAGFTELYEERVVDIEAERRQAYAEGHEVATQELSEKHQVELEERASAHSLALATLRAEYEIR